MILFGNERRIVLPVCDGERCWSILKGMAQAITPFGGAVEECRLVTIWRKSLGAESIDFVYSASFYLIVSGFRNLRDQLHNSINPNKSPSILKWTLEFSRQLTI